MNTFDGCFIVFFIMGIVIAVCGIRSFTTRRKMLQGTPTTGKIQGIRPVPSRGRIPIFYYLVEYDLDGRKWQGQSLQQDVGTNPMREGKSVRVFVNPDKPGYVYIQDEQCGGLNGSVLGCVICLGIGVALIAVGIVGIALGW